MSLNRTANGIPLWPCGAFVDYASHGQGGMLPSAG